MQEPPEYFLPFMHTIESTVLKLWKELRSMNDSDVEFVYEKLKDYFRKKVQGKDLGEPETSSERRQALIDELLNAIDMREEIEADIPFINDPDYAPTGVPISSLASFYMMCFNRLIKSVRMWRKEYGPKGYLSFIDKHVM